MKLAANQSNYLPWKGYFDIINSVDVFVFYDDVQYTNRDWRNRNRIKTQHGSKWLTVPCSSSRDQMIYEVETSNFMWQKKHWRSLVYNYRNSPYFETYSPFFEEVYYGHTWTHLSELNQYLIKYISQEILDIQTRFVDSRQFHLHGRKGDRLLDLLTQCEVTNYLCGPAAREYLNVEQFREAGIEVEWMDYSGYPEYDQLFPPFDHYVSIVDLLFNTGPQATDFMLSFKPSNTAR